MLGFLNRPFRQKGKARYRASFTFLLIAGLVLRAFPWDSAVKLRDHPNWREFLIRLPVGLGEALIIALIISALVDSEAKRSMLREFAENVSLHIIGRWLPKELRAHLEGYLASDLLRKDWVIQYNIETWPDQSKFFKLRSAIEYKIENRGESDRDYDFRYDVEESFFPHLGKAKIIKCSGGATEDPERHDSFEYPRDSKIECLFQNNSYSVARKIAIPAGKVFRFTAESEECFRDGSSIPFFTYCPVLSSTLILNYPTDRLDIFVDLSFGDIETDATSEKTDTGVVWTFVKPILPGQGFSIRVYDKNTVQQAPVRKRGKKRHAKNLNAV